jgi:hypothetical protein
MSTAARWLVVLVALLLVLGMGAYARGPKHHHGDEIGTHGTPPPAQSQ